MTGENIEGTIALEGLIQGRLADEDGALDRLREWTSFMAKLGLPFNLETRHAAFSLLPENRAASAASLGDPPEAALEQALAQLIDALPAALRGQVFSTLRSTHYRPGEEVQTVYAIVDGQVRMQTRTLEADTTPPPKPISTRDRVKLGAVGGAVALLLLAIALLFPGVRNMFGQVAQSLRPLDVGDIEVDLGPYEGFLTADLDPKASRREAIVVQLHRTDAFPTDGEQIDAAVQAATTTTQRLALHNLARGYVRVELFGEDDRYLGACELRVAGLRPKATVSARLPLPEKKKVVRIVFVL